MESKLKFDFGGYATKSGIRCADGRTILKDAFKHQDGQKVPLVWQHLHNDPENVLGYAILEHRDDGDYAYCTFNENPKAQNAKELVAHGDITALSIYANQLKEQAKKVAHGVIREVSLVLAPSNPVALIDNLSFSHGDGLDPIIDDTEAIIYSGALLEDESLQHISNSDGQKILSDELSSLSDSQKSRLRNRVEYMEDDTQIEAIFNLINAMSASQRVDLYKFVSDGTAVAQHKDSEEDSKLQHAKHADDATVQDVLNTLDETQKNVVYAMIAKALSEGEEVRHSENEGETFMKNNVFDQSTENQTNSTLTHSQIEAIFADAKKTGSLRDSFESFLAHAADYGIENIDVLFPDAKLIRNTPDVIKRDDSWVSAFLSAIYKTPFSRIKSTAVDMTADQARAKGYMTGKRKKDEVLTALKRTTSPTTVYKKQKLDRDDIVDIVDFDVVVWIRAEMRMMLEEELARAALIGDGREIDDEDHISSEHIRPIWTDDEIYAPKKLLSADITTNDLIDEIVRARKLYKGSGSPNLYTTEDIVTDMLLVRDLNQRRIYLTIAELASALRVNQIISVEVMEEQTRTIPDSGDRVELLGIIVNPRDYSMGADKGGQVSVFDDFDIDYNQQKYLIETRVSGALTKPKSAVVIEKKLASG